MECYRIHISYKINVMAELNTSSAGRKKGPGVKKGKKLSTRVDLTPMVDLGFLLITFFIFTTTMSHPTAMKLFLPTDSKDSTAFPGSAVITLMPADHNLIYYYEGADPNNLEKADFKSIRNIILDKKRRSNPTYFEVILKPTPDATYGNTVNILDEMKIDEVPRYTLTDITSYEYKLIRSRFP